MQEKPDALLSIRKLNVQYLSREVLRDINLDIGLGEIVGFAGESGAGKTTLALAVMNLVSFYGGRITGSVSFNGKAFQALSREQMRALRGRELAMVFQNPQGALNPVYSVRAQFREVLRAHGSLSKEEVHARTGELLEAVQLPATEDLLDAYPHQLSGGMAQRVVIGLAIAHHPRLLIADEPTSDLDVSTQAEILDLFKKLNRDLGITILFISHNLAVLAAICDRIAVLKEGEIVESGTVADVFSRPQHPYTKKLLDSLPHVRSYRQPGHQGPSRR